VRAELRESAVAVDDGAMLRYLTSRWSMCWWVYMLVRFTLLDIFFLVLRHPPLVTYCIHRSAQTPNLVDFC
jgi:hypothetical protein